MCALFLVDCDFNVHAREYNSSCKQHTHTHTSTSGKFNDTSTGKRLDLFVFSRSRLRQNMFWARSLCIKCIPYRQQHNRHWTQSIIYTIDRFDSITHNISRKTFGVSSSHICPPTNNKKTTHTHSFCTDKTNIWAERNHAVHFDKVKRTHAYMRWAHWVLRFVCT